MALPETWRCAVCGDRRPDDKINVAYRPLAGLEHMFPETRSNIGHCNDRPECIDWAHREGPWVGPPLIGVSKR